MKRNFSTSTYIIGIFNHSKLSVAVARQNFAWVEIAHIICLILEQIFVGLIAHYKSSLIHKKRQHWLNIESMCRGI